MRRRTFLVGLGLFVAGCGDMRRMLMAGGGSGSFAAPVAAVYSVNTLTSPSEGGWVWFGARRAIRSGDTTIAGYITGNSGGDVKAIQIDNDTRTLTATSTLYNNFQVDDHDPPSFIVRPDGIIMAAFAFHLGEIYVGIGPSVGVLPAQAQVTNITSQVGSLSGSAGYTYASIFLVGTRYYVFFRYHNPSGVPYLGYTYSDDDGVTWAARTLVIQITYHQVVQSGSRLDFVLSDHPLYGQADDGVTKTSIYHLYLESGSWFLSNGATAGSLPIANTGATRVYDGTTERAWLWDIAIDVDGRPRVVYVVYEDTFPSAPWHYEYGRWTGSAWVTHEVADAGGAFPAAATPEHGNNYAGGIVLDHEDPTVVYYSSNAGGTFQLYRAVTTDDGASWTETPLTSDSDKNVRPVSVIGHDGRIAALFLYGTYDDYFTYAQGIKVVGTP